MNILLDDEFWIKYPEPEDIDNFNFDELNDYEQFVLQRPIHLASKYAPKEILELMILKGVNINVEDYENKTPLIYAIEGDKEDNAKFLINRNIDMTVRDEYSENNPLFKAIEYSSLDLIDYMIQNGADYKYYNVHNGTVINQSIKKGTVEKLEYFLNLGLSIDDDIDPIHIALENENPEMLKYILTMPFDINETNNMGESPLFKSANISYEYFNILLKSGADIKKENLQNLLSNTKDTDTILYLMDNGADIFNKTDYNIEPIKTYVYNDILAELYNKIKNKIDNSTKVKDKYIITKLLLKIENYVENNNLDINFS